MQITAHSSLFYHSMSIILPIYHNNPISHCLIDAFYHWFSYCTKKKLVFLENIIKNAVNIYKLIFISYLIDYNMVYKLFQQFLELIELTLINQHQIFLFCLINNYLCQYEINVNFNNINRINLMLENLVNYKTTLIIFNLFFKFF